MKPILRIIPRVLLVGMLAVSTICLSQVHTVGTGVFHLETDHAVFFGNDSVSYVEIYYGIRESMLSYAYDSGRYTGGVVMHLDIRNEAVEVASREWRVPHTCTDLSATASGKTLMGMESLGLAPGTYRYSITTIDVNDTTRRETLASSLVVRGFAGITEALSDIELSSTIKQPGDSSSRFFKNTVEVIPNASKTFGTGLPILYYYAEVYNLAKRNPDHHVKIRSSIYSGGGRELMFQERRKARTHNSTVEIGTMNLSALKSGSYQLRIGIVDTTSSPPNILAMVEKKFFIFRQGGNDSAGSGEELIVASNEFDFMKEPELDDAFDRAKYLAVEIERDQYERLTEVAAKRKFLSAFWNRRDSDPSTSRNEFREEYTARLEYATRSFATPYMAGWKTDRGRIHILYGPSDEIERFSSTSESVPYEIWHYYSLQGGVIFAFVDRNGLGEYNLVHSTHRDELRNDNWFRDFAQRAR